LEPSRGCPEMRIESHHDVELSDVLPEGFNPDGGRISGLAVAFPPRR
jgi:hypothetical protein